MRCSHSILSVTAIAASALLWTPAMAQGGAAPPAKPPVVAPAATPAAAAPAADTVLARVAGDEIHASDLAEAAQTLPEEMRGMPPQMLYPMLLDQLIDRHALVLAARKDGLQNDPLVQKQIARATDSALQNVLLTRAIAPSLTDDAIKARYDRDFAGKSGEEEVHAAHILVADEAKAKAIIADIKAGKDFNDLAKENSTDPSAKNNGGDLGFFKKTDMLPEFADAAFALKPGEISQTPIKTQFGWHVIKVIERRSAPPAALDQMRDEIRQSLIQEGVSKVLAQAKTGLKIEKFNQDGTPMAAAPAAPAPAPATAPATAPAPAK
jgi:peptidyl-prolyl cis-trans isomerase C